MKKASLILMAVFYIGAGVNHFYNPEAYYKIIPDFFTNPGFINICSGLAEILLGVSLFFPFTRNFACQCIIALLIAFIPAHIYMINIGFCIRDYCLPDWALWMRLVVLQPILIYWAWKNRIIPLQVEDEDE